jgi:hypothetical protein
VGKLGCLQQLYFLHSHLQQCLGEDRWPGISHHASIVTLGVGMVGYQFFPRRCVFLK